jgi:hypothetical protein
VKAFGGHVGQAITMSLIFSLTFGWMLLWVLSLKCDLTYITDIVAITIAVLACFYIVALLYDVFLSFKYIKMNGIVAMLKMDAFLFRIEFLFTVFICLPLVIISQIITFIRFAGDDPTITRYSDIILLGVVESLAFPSMYFVACYFSLIITIVQWIRAKCQKKTAGLQIMERVLEDAEGSALFLQFAKTEYSPENIWCRNAIVEFRKAPSLSLATTIYLTYFDGANSELEVNVQGVHRRKIKQELEAMQVSRDMFDQLYLEVIQTLSDTFVRFQISSQYTTYERKKEFFSDVQNK